MWYPSHFLTIPLGYACILVAALFSRRLSADKRRKLLQILVILLFIGEFGKQISVLSDYSANYLPFHYSSTYYLTFALLAFGRGRVKHFGACTSFIGGVMLFVTMTVNPHAVVGDTANMFESYYHAYSYFYHIAVLLIWLIMLLGNEYRWKRGDIFRYAAFFAGWLCVAVPAAFYFRMNYAGILHSFIPLLETFRLKYGQIPYLLVYAAFILVSAELLFLLFRALQALFRTLREKKESKAEKQNA